MSGKQSFKWSSACLSDVGKVRKINEDACLDLQTKGIWAVADGMGGHQSGDLASSKIIDALRQISHSDSLDALVREAKDHLLAVNEYLYQEASRRDKNQTIGSTVVVLLARQDHCAFLWVGDSRLYRLRDGQLTRLTKDHSPVQKLIDSGMLAPELAETHPASNIITRAVGADKSLDLDGGNALLQDGDTYLLCTDGLYKEISEEEIADILRQESSQVACRMLVDLALNRKCSDNVSVVVVKVCHADLSKEPATEPITGTSFSS